MKARIQNSARKHDEGRKQTLRKSVPADDARTMDLRAVLDAWPYDPGRNVRLARAPNGREIIQVRQPMGLEQYEIAGRPDGLRPHGAESAWHFQLARLAAAEAAEAEPRFRLSSAECAELFAEAKIYDERLRHLLRLRDWERAARDSGRNLRALDFLTRHAEHEEDRAELEPWRPGTLRMDAIARGVLLLESGRYGEALALAQAALDVFDGDDGHSSLRETLLRKLAECLKAHPVDRARGESHFIRQGDYRTISYQGKSGHFKETRGLAVLAGLLRQPGREFHVSELLVHPVEPPEGSLIHLANGDRLAPAGHAPSGEPMLDARAKTEFRRRIAELRDDLAEAERRNDTARGSQVREEMDAIAGQLASALGLGGRDRQAGSPSERARSAVTKRIKESIAKIGEVLPLLGRHLSARIKTGYFCSYHPHPDRPVMWKF